MGIYIFTWKKLKEYLINDEANEQSSNDFGKDIIPAMLNNGEKLVSYRFKGYWKDVGTIESLWEANMDLLSPNSGLQLSDDSWKIYGRTTGSLRISPPSRLRLPIPCSPRAVRSTATFPSPSCSRMLRSARVPRWNIPS